MSLPHPASQNQPHAIVPAHSSQPVTDLRPYLDPSFVPPNKVTVRLLQPEQTLATESAILRAWVKLGDVAISESSQINQFYFHNPHLALLAAVILRLNKDGVRFNNEYLQTYVQTVSTTPQAQAQLPHTLQFLMDNAQAPVCTLSELKGLVAQLFELGQRGIVAQRTEALMTQLRNGAITTYDFCIEMTKVVSAVQGLQPSQLRNAADIARDIKDQIEMRQVTHRYPLATGLACDSVCYGGFLPDEGDTALIVASTGKGKSKLALQMTLNMCHQTYAGEPVVALYISFELGAGVLAQRAIQNLSGFPLGMARNNQYDERYFAGVDALSKLSLHLTYSTQSTIEAVISMITAFDNQQVANGKPVSRVVVIDSLNLMSVGNIGGKSSSNYDATANNASAQAAFSGAFKEFFKETKKVGLLVSQLKQTIGDSKNPTTLDVYGGSANPVDFAFALVDKGQESACQYALHVMKNRHGFTGAEFELFSDTRHNILLSLEPEALAKNYLYKPQTPTTYPTHSADEDVL